MNKRVKITIGGLNTVDPPGSVADGMFEQLHNIRISQQGVASNVRQFATHLVIDDAGSLEVCYAHAALAVGEFVAVEGWVLWRVRLNKERSLEKIEQIWDPQADLWPGLSEQAPDYVFSAFGNVLYVDSKAIGKSAVFVLYENRYRKVDMDEIRPPEPVSISYDYKTSRKEASIPASLVAVANLIVSDAATSGGGFLVESYNLYHNLYVDEFITSGYVYGAQYLMFAYRLYDGSVIKNSRIWQLDSEQEAEANEYSLFYIRPDKEDKVYFYKNLSAIKTKLTFEVSEAVRNNPLIESIVVYATRNYPLCKLDDLYRDLDFNDPQKRFVSLGGKTYTNISCRSILNEMNHKVADSVFYEIAEIDFRKGDLSLDLNFGQHYDNIEQYPIFEPGLSVHTLSSKEWFEYNARAHRWDVSTDFFAGETQLFTGETFWTKGFGYRKAPVLGGAVVFRYLIQAGMERFYRETRRPAPLYYDLNFGGDSRYLIVPNLITYPDVRAIGVEIIYEKPSGERVLLKTYPLKKALSNNYAYFVDTNRDKLMSHTLIDVEVFGVDPGSVDTGAVLRQPNRILVSQPDNPFVYLHKHLVDIPNAQTKIFALNTTTDQLTESGFGSYPLYVFTDNGIYALQSGNAGVLYAALVKLNNDSVRENTPTVSAGNRIYYFTARGLYWVYGRESRCVSEPIATLEIAGFPFSEFVKSCRLLYLPAHEELLMVRPEADVALVFSLGVGCFSTRDFRGRLLSNRLLLSDGEIYDILRNEVGSLPLPATAVSRELKLGSRDFKRVAEIVFLGRLGGDFCARLFASNDARDWYPVGECLQGDRLRRLSASWCYYKVSVTDTNMEWEAMEVAFRERFPEPAG